MKNTLKFSENGKEFTIMFANGGESLEIKSKEEGFNAITSLADERKITVEEFAEMREQILQAQHLAWGKDDKNSSHKITVELSNAVFESLVPSLIEHITDIKNSEHLEGVSTFVVCECGTHGKIYAFLDEKSVYVGHDVDTKEKALKSLNSIIEGKNFSNEVIEKLMKEIVESTLPENTDTEMTETNSQKKE